METLTKSCSPTIVMTANGEVQTHEEATVHVKELDIFLTMKVLEEYASSLIARKAFAMNTDNSYEWINGQKPHHIKKRYSNTVQHGELRSDRGSWLISEFFLQLALFNIHDTLKAGDLIILRLPQARLPHQPRLCQATVKLEDGKTRSGIDSHPAPVSSSHVERTERGDPLTKPTKKPKPNKNKDPD